MSKKTRRWARGKTAVLITPQRSHRVIPRAEARLQLQYGQAELVVCTANIFTVRSLWFPAFEDEQKYQQGRFVTGFTHAGFNGVEGGPGVIRCRPPANRFSEEYLRLKQLLAKGFVKRGA